jgi:hypothetical protein
MSLNEPRRLEAAPNFLSGFREKSPGHKQIKKIKTERKPVFICCQKQKYVELRFSDSNSHF